MGRPALVTVIVVLAIALAFETGYIVRMQAGGRSAEPKQLSRPAAYAAPLTAPPRRPAYSMTTWDPYAEMERMQGMMNRLFDESFGRGHRQDPLAAGSGFYEPDIDVETTPTEYRVIVDLPGIDKDKISVKIQDRRLLISGERDSAREESRDDAGFYRMERSFGSFLRTVPLPEDADAAGMTASSENGVLTVRIPRHKKEGSP